MTEFVDLLETSFPSWAASCEGMCNNQLVVIYIYLFILETLPGVSDLLNNPS